MHKDQSGDHDHLSILTALNGTVKTIAYRTAPVHDAENLVVGAVLVFRDISEKIRMENDLLRAQKLESLGVLAGGIAHDFNNILTSIIGNISIAKYTDLAEDRHRKYLDEAEKASLRAKDLAQQLLTFSRGGAPIKEKVAIADVIRESAGFALTGAQTRCEFSPLDGLWTVEVDEGQISQVIHNMIINADQAMPNGGIIRISLENILISQASLLPLPPGKYICIEIRDTGVGLPNEYLDKIFDPYFTTKQTGSGLGLTSSYSIIKKHGGHVTVESAMGKGTVFRIYLPASEEDPVKKETGATLIRRGSAGYSSWMTNNPSERLSEKMLDYLGYEAAFASDGAEGIAAYLQSVQEARPFDVIIVDLTIPGSMGGLEMTEKLLELYPQLKVIVSSGYSTDPVNV